MRLFYLTTIVVAAVVVEVVAVAAVVVRQAAFPQVRLLTLLNLEGEWEGEPRIILFSGRNHY